MTSPAFIAWIACVLFFIFLLLLTGWERKRNQRFFASTARNWLDIKFDHLGISLVRNWEHFIKYIVQLNWYYSIHSVLRTLLQLIVRFYTYFEHMFERNRARTKQLRAEKRKSSGLGHLQKMTQHKEETALTPSQKKKLRHKKLEEKH